MPVVCSYNWRDPLMPLVEAEDRDEIFKWITTVILKEQQ